jgi:hypothetical protein
MRATPSGGGLDERIKGARFADLPHDLFVTAPPSG